MSTTISTAEGNGAAAGANVSSQHGSAASSTPTSNGGGDNNGRPLSINNSTAQEEDEAHADGVDDLHSRRPADVALKQQRMKSWQPLLDPKWVISAYLLIGLLFIPSGFVIRNQSDNLIELHTIYESHLEKGPPADIAGCEIYNNPNQMYLQQDPPQYCRIRMQVPFDKGDMEPPIMVHYELYNFYQNYRRYVYSRDQYQLLGSLKEHTVSTGECEPLRNIGGVKINPCGLIANTLFNDVIALESIVGPDGAVVEDAPMVEEGVAWRSDLEWKYKQPDGFRSEECASCDGCDCEQRNDAGEKAWSCKAPYRDEDGKCFRYWYPEDDTTQYLYETYPMVVNPLEGVTNEHFVVWMRVAALPHFRKLYGYIEQTIPAGSVLTFKVQANYAIQRSKGAKALVVSNTYAFGGKNHWLGTLFIAVGGIAAVFGLFFLGKEVLAPRKLGDKMYLKFKED